MAAVDKAAASVGRFLHLLLIHSCIGRKITASKAARNSGSKKPLITLKKKKPQIRIVVTSITNDTYRDIVDPFFGCSVDSGAGLGAGFAFGLGLGFAIGYCCLMVDARLVSGVRNLQES